MPWHYVLAENYMHQDMHIWSRARVSILTEYAFEQQPNRETILKNVIQSEPTNTSTTIRSPNIVLS